MSNGVKAPPHSIEAEQAVIGALLRDNDAVDRIGDLRAEHFYLADHGIIFGELMRQIVAGKQCDVISVMVALSHKVQDAGKYLNSMQQATPSSANIARYAAIVRDKSVKRGLINLGRDIADSAANGPEESGAMIDQASSRLEQLAESRVKLEPVRAGADMAVHIGEIEARLQGGTKAISTGYPALDERLSGGIRRGELIVLAARPKMGKTALAMNVACNVARDHSVLYLSMEMPRSQLHDRNLANLGRIPLPHLLQPTKMTDQDWGNLTHATIKVDELNLFLDDQGSLRMLDVRMKAKAVKRRAGLDLLVVDYLQLMEGDGDNRNAQIEGITRGLKGLAKELDMGLVLLSQLNRKLEERPDKRPKPSDLRDSGSIEQDADAVVLLYRDEVYNPDSTEIGICEVDVPLCRQGAPGRVALSYIGEQTRFAPLDRSWMPRTQERPLERRRRGLAEAL
ncbi:replicative DNA helicase [Massilia oculi]|uniref:Replicative DNA helicase n=1 Tax=Massilia hydrophila TaxID=3044279 RepID=A0ABS7YFW6_9BURK|nr:replicative DNA helicase [Massilia oculi]MCA1857434.1 replicative DNA helicase [Massilia oculi]